MARRPRLFAPGLLYHVMVRGNQRQKTFLKEQDYQAYLERVAKYRKRCDAVLYAYCLMPNHVHLLLETSREPLAKFMQGLQQSYTQYFNRTHHKVGHLFQGRYKLIAKPEEYPYSGHRVYLTGKATEVLDPAWGLALFGGRAAYRRFVLEGLAEGHREEYYEAADQRFLGAEDFGKRMQA